MVAGVNCIKEVGEVKKTFYRNETIKRILDKKNDNALFILLLGGILAMSLLWGEEAGFIFFLAFGGLTVYLKLINRTDD